MSLAILLWNLLCYIYYSPVAVFEYWYFVPLEVLILFFCPARIVLWQHLEQLLLVILFISIFLSTLCWFMLINSEFWINFLLAKFFVIWKFDRCSGFSVSRNQVHIWILTLHLVMESKLVFYKLPIVASIQFCIWINWFDQSSLFTFQACWFWSYREGKNSHDLQCVDTKWRKKKLSRKETMSSMGKEITKDFTAFCRWWLYLA